MSVFHGKSRLPCTINSKQQANLHTHNLLLYYNVWPELCTVGVDAKISTKCQYSVGD